MGVWKVWFAVNVCARSVSATVEGSCPAGSVPEIPRAVTAYGVDVIGWRALKLA